MQGDWHDGRPEDREGLTIWLTAAFLYFLLAWTTIELTAGNSHGIAAFWPANAVLVALLHAGRPPRWKTVLSAGFLANIAANLVTRGTLLGPVLFGVSNMLEVVVAVVLMRRLIGRSCILSDPVVVGRFILIAGGIAPLLSGIAGAATASVALGQPFLPSFDTWVVSDALGLLVFTPVFLALFSGDVGIAVREASWRRRTEGLALGLLTIAVAGAVFFVMRFPMLFVLFCPVILMTFRLGRLGTKTAVMLIAVIGTVATARGIGPIAYFTADRAQQALLFQEFLAVLLLTCLPLAAGLAARGRITSALAEREQLLAHRASVDSLTGLLNRSAFQDRAAEAIATQAATQCLVAIDVDRFKAVNDRWGHHAGDQALIHLAAVLQAQLRTCDVIGRVGGDEFMLLLPGTDTGEAEVICNRVRAALRRMSLSVDEKTEIMISISCGLAGTRPGIGYQELAKRADQALYLAKAAGRNAVRAVA